MTEIYSPCFPGKCAPGTTSSVKFMARIYDNETANKIGILWSQVENAVVELDSCMKTEAAEQLVEEWKRFREEFERFYDILTDAWQP